MAITQDRTIERLVDGAPPFLIKLYNMVDDKETNSIISWGSTSSTFIISDEPRFVSEILPRYFKSNRFDSFASQLRNYGFAKKEWNQLEFEHENFKQGKRDLLKIIKRKNRQSNYNNHVINNMCASRLCDQLKSTFVKTRHEQKQITDRILRLKDDTSLSSFKHTSLSSFISQLNIYCFKKVSWERREYANKWFIGGRYELLANITRRDKLIGIGETCSLSQLEGYMTQLRKIQHHQENQITWLSKYEQQIKSSMHELKQSVAVMDNILNKKIVKSGENLENMKARELDKQSAIGNEKEQQSGDNHVIETRDTNNMEQQSYFQELEIDQEAFEKIIEMKDDTLIEMDEEAVEEIIEMKEDTFIETDCYESLWRSMKI